MRSSLLIGIFAATTIPLGAQTASPPPKKDPFANFGAGLDRKKPPSAPANPPAAPLPAGPAGSKTGGLKLNGNWDSKTTLARGGPTQQSKELHALLTGWATPGRDLGAAPATRIYRDITYLLPFAEAQARLGLGGTMKSGGKSAAVGFPDGIEFVSFSADGSRPHETRLLYDKAGQVVAVEFVAGNPRDLPPPPDPLPLTPDKTRKLAGRTYDFVPQGTSAAGQRYWQQAWDVTDYVLIATRGGPRSADLYVPKPMVSITLHCLDTLSRP